MNDCFKKINDDFLVLLKSYADDFDHVFKDVKGGVRKLGRDETWVVF